MGKCLSRDFDTANYPLETKVKRGVRMIQGKHLEEKLGRKDQCPRGSGQRFKR
ncbi:SEC-C metal-binding domain-containing protein [Novipirellula sp. SH528]|uniref:SEC-C metal-binding domain-containing protein n=1 Tax=Novipirellula sp. SH528 TaxID=3454466 RepID=UPI003F9F5CDB